MRRSVARLGTSVLRAALFASPLLFASISARAQERIQERIQERAQEVAGVPAVQAPLPHLQPWALATSPFRDAMDSLPEAEPTRTVVSLSIQDAAELPDAPSAALQPTSNAAGQEAPREWSHIPADMQGRPLSSGDKFHIAARDTFHWESFASLFLAAGYSHLVNGQPNYGTDRGAFGQRLGATAIREGTQNFLAEGLFPSIFHEDPRYYELGSQHGFVQRGLYAITRPLVTRNDAGHNTLNRSLLAGYAGAAALTPLYYPSSNRNGMDVFETYASSIGGAALGDLFNEFAPQLFSALHLRTPR